MSASDMLEVVAIFGSIVVVWFALIGWRLLPRVSGRSFPAWPR